MAMAYDLIRVQKFYLQTEIWVKMLLFDKSLSAHIDNKKKDILVFGTGPIQGLGNTTLTAEAQYSINQKQTKEFV